MRLVELLKKIFVPSYTDRKVQPLVDENARRLEEAGRAIKSHKKTLRSTGDVAMNVYLASGGKHGH